MITDVQNQKYFWQLKCNVYISHRLRTISKQKQILVYPGKATYLFSKYYFVSLLRVWDPKCNGYYVLDWKQNII